MKRITSTASLTLALLLAACGPARPAALSNDQVTAGIVNILTALDAGDYASFSTDFSPTLKAALPETQFTALMTLINNTSGKVVSCGTSPQLSNSQAYAVYRLSCKFELEPVIVTVSIKTGGTQVEGLYFDSTNLRKAVQPTSTPSNEQ